jgi:hypothetical protein
MNDSADNFSEPQEFGTKPFIYFEEGEPEDYPQRYGVVLVLSDFVLAAKGLNPEDKDELLIRGAVSYRECLDMAGSKWKQTVCFKGKEGKMYSKISIEGPNVRTTWNRPETPIIP